MDKENSDKIKLLINGCIERDLESQKQLYKEFYAYGMSISLRYADNRDEAAEILNDGFLKVFTNMEKYDPAMPFKPWLRRVLINTAINAYNKKRLNFKTESLNTQKYDIEVESEDILSGISYQEIIGMLQELPPAYRTVFNLYVIEGYNHEEIGKILGISAGTSKSNLHKAKAQLKIMLKKNFESRYVS